jgi:hypothetical protein
MKLGSFPKFALLLPLAGVLTLALAGCGSTIKNTALTQGNWAFTASSTAPGKASPTSFVLGGNLSQSGTNLTGTMYITGSGCIPAQFVSFTGTVKDKTVTLTSAAFGGQVISITASGGSDSLTGAYTVTGECADSGNVTASSVASITGTWNGTILNPAQGKGGLGIAGATLSIVLTQAATASENGTFALSGTLTYTNSACSVSGTISNGYMAGNFISFNGATVDIDGEGEFAYDNGHLDSVTAPHNMTGDYSVDFGTCEGQSVSLTLTKQ